MQLLQHVIDFWSALSLPTQALVAYVAVWLCSMLRNFSYRTLGARIRVAQQGLPATAPPVSVVLIFQGNEALLHRLPQFLGQHYPEFEVIVVCEQQPTDFVKHYFTEMQHAYPDLHICTVPANGLDISVHNLAVTLGMRAAQYDWVLLGNLSCVPQSMQWLAHMAAAIGEAKYIVTGITNYVPAQGTSLFKYRFLHLWHRMMVFTWAGKHKLVEAEETNLLYNKTHFLQHGGLQEGAALLEGAVPLAVNRHANRCDAALCLHPEAIMWQDAPAGKQACQWLQIMHQNIWRRMRWAWWLDVRSNAHALLTWMHTLTFLIAMAVCLLQPNIPVLYLCVLLVLCLLHALWRDVAFHYTLRAMLLSPVHALLPLMLHVQPLLAMATRYRYMKTNKKLFRKRFV